jgi:hypothetical protein
MPIPRQYTEAQRLGVAGARRPGPFRPPFVRRQLSVRPTEGFRGGSVIDVAAAAAADRDEPPVGLLLSSRGPARDRE